MPIISSVREMARLLAKPQQELDEHWACSVCQASRKIHIDIWRERFAKKYVADTIVNLMAKALKKMFTVRDSFEDLHVKEIVTKYLKNIAKRLFNIHNYLTNQAPAFPADDRLMQELQDTGMWKYKGDLVLSPVGVV